MREVTLYLEKFRASTGVHDVPRRSETVLIQHSVRTDQSFFRGGGNGLRSAE